MNTIRNAWEFTTDEHELFALAGHVSRDEFERDRQQRAQEVVGWCSIQPVSRGFEIGSGEGTVARILAAQCQSLDCNDISQSFLAKARANCAQYPNVSFHRIESEYLDHLPANSFDFGFSLNVFIHFNAYDVFHYLQSVKRILKPGGVFYFDACSLGEQTMPLFREHAELYKRAPEGVRGLLNYNHPKTLQFLVREVGLRLSQRSQFSETGWMKVLTEKA